MEAFQLYKLFIDKSRAHCGAGVHCISQAKDKYIIIEISYLRVRKIITRYQYKQLKPNYCLYIFSNILY